MGNTMYAGLAKPVPSCEEFNVLHFIDSMEHLEKYNEISAGLQDLQCKCALYNSLKQHGFHESAIVAMGGENLLQSIGIRKHEYDGKSDQIKGEVCMANLGTWIREKAAWLWKKIKDFVVWLIDRVALFFNKRKMSQITAEAQTLQSMSKIPEDVECHFVFDKKELMTKLGKYRDLITYNRSWLNELNTYLPMINDMDITSANKPNIPRDFTSFESFFNSYKRNIQPYTRDSGFVVDRTGGVFTGAHSADNGEVIDQYGIPTNAGEKVSPFSMGWESGSDIRNATNLINTVVREGADLGERLQIQLKQTNAVAAYFQAMNVSSPGVVLETVTAANEISKALAEITGFLLTATSKTVTQAGIYVNVFGKMVEELNDGISQQKLLKK